MRGLVLKLALLATSALSLDLTSSAAAAAADDNQAVPQIEEIVVTATRREERLQDVPISITVYNQQQLSNQNVVNADDLALRTPSLGANTNFGSANSNFAIRGFYQDIGTAPSVGVFFDDVVAPRALAQGEPAGDGAGPGDFFDLQNVQILKGPQGTLFGRNTTGGDILLVPQKPTDEFGGYVEGSFGNYNMRSGEGVINIPVNDDIRLRFGVDHMSRAGYLINTSGVGPKDYDDIDYTALRASADIDVTPNLENYTVATYTNSRTNGSVQKMVGCDTAEAGVVFGLFLNACNQLTPGSSTYQGSNFYDMSENAVASPRTTLKEWRIINTTTWSVNDNLTVKNVASYAQLQNLLDTALFATNFSLGGVLPIPFAASTPIPGHITADSATYTEEFQLQGNAWDNRFIWQAGLYLEGTVPLATVGAQSPVLAYCLNVATLDCSDPIGTVFTLEAGMPVHIGAVNYTAGAFNENDYAAYAQATYKLTDEFKVTGGIRYTEDRTSNTNRELTYNFGAGFFPPVPIIPACTIATATLPNCSSTFVQRSHAPTWLVDLDYTPTDNILAYAKYSRGYREGAINPNIPEPYTYAGPERVDSYEGGIKASFGGPIPGTFDISGFYNDLANQQLLLGFSANPCYANGGPSNPCIPSNIGPSSAAINAGTSHIDGLELETNLRPFEGMSLDISYSFLNAKIIKANVGTPCTPYDVAEPLCGTGFEKAGDVLPLSPRNKVSITAAYTLPLDQSIGDVTVSATFTHTDAQLTNYADGDVPNDPQMEALDFIQPTNILDLDLNWNEIAGKPVDLSLFATNVTGDKYYTWTAGLGSSTGFDTAQVGQPTMYGVRLKVHFGNE